MKTVIKPGSATDRTDANGGPPPALYMRVADIIRRQIRSGELRPGERLPAFQDLCRQYDVSNITIRGAIRSLSEEGLIIREERKGVFVAKIDAKPSTSVIGCHGFHHAMRHLPYYFHIFQGLQRGVGRAGYEMLILDHDEPSVSWEKIDALILMGAEDEELLRRLPPGMCSVALLNFSSTLPSIISDDYSGMRHAVSHLWNHGHRKIAYLHEDDHLTPDRVRGYQDELAIHDIAADPAWGHRLMPHHPEEFRGRGRETMRQWLKDGWYATGCTGLICQNDRTAIGVMEAFRDAGIRVPGEVSLIGFDSTDECDLVTPRLTSVKVPLEEMGEKATEVLFALMRARESGVVARHEVTVLPTYIEERDSVGPAR